MAFQYLAAAEERRDKRKKQKVDWSLVILWGCMGEVAGDLDEDKEELKEKED